METFAARSGALSVRVDGRALHSPYDPRREAERFVAERLGGENPGTVVVLGEGLGHVSEAVRAAFPLARIIPVIYAEEVYRAALPTAAGSWHPGAAVPVGGFLRAELSELDIEGLSVVEWPASSQAFPAAARAAAEAARRVALELNGSFATTCASSGTWLRNSIANFLSLDAVLPRLPGRPDSTVIIAAPGPSLERAARFIRSCRDRAELWALPSSCPFLAAEGLAPDVVVLTDPGFYAMHHIASARVMATLVMPLSAARGSWALAAAGGAPPVLLLSQPVFYERALLRAAGLASPEITPHGTVAATAVELARSATSAPVIVAGLDMCMRDVLSHARPNAFDVLLQVVSGRLSPHAGLWYERAVAQQAAKLAGSGGERVTPALRTYAGWFSEPGDPARPTWRLLPSSVPLAGMREISGEELEALLREAVPAGSAPEPGRRVSPVPLPDRAARRRIVSDLLAGWLGLLEECAPEELLQARGAGDPGPEPTPLSIAYMTGPRLLMEARRLQRLDRVREARESVERLRVEAAAGLRGIRDRACREP